MPRRVYQVGRHIPAKPPKVEYLNPSGGWQEAKTHFDSWDALCEETEKLKGIYFVQQEWRHDHPGFVPPC